MSRGRGWVAAALVSWCAACSSSGVVLETKHGDPTPPSDAGSASSDDAGPPRGVDPEMLRSGTRIHVRGEVADGELLAVDGAHDMLRDVDCSIQVADDGVSRCLPQFASSTTTIVFLDPDCTEPVLRVGYGAAPCYQPTPLPPFVMYQSSFQQCPEPGTHVLRPGTEIQPPDQPYAYSAQAIGTGPPMFACQPSSPGSAKFYTVTPSAATEWVAFDKSVTALTSRLGIVQWSGSDGSRMTADTVLLPDDTVCSPGAHPISYTYPANPDAVAPCIPTSTGSTYFSDSACTNAVTVGRGCDPPGIIAEYPPPQVVSACDTYNPEISYFAVGPALATSALYLNIGSCQPADSMLGGLTAFAKGTPVDPASFPQMQTVPSGTGRVRPWVWQSDGVAIGLAGSWTDRETGEPAQPMQFGAITRAAFSTQIDDDKFYSDAACKTKLFAVPVPDASLGICPGATPMKSRWAVFVQTTTTLEQFCGGQTYEPSVHPVGAVHTGKVFTLNPDVNASMNGACSEYVPSKTPESYTFYDLGNPVPASSLFAEVKTVDL